MVFYGPSGIGLARGYSEYSAHVLAPRRAAFEARSFELDVLSCEGAYCGAHGHLRGTHAGCYLARGPGGRPRCGCASASTGTSSTASRGRAT